MGALKKETRIRPPATHSGSRWSSISHRDRARTSVGRNRCWTTSIQISFGPIRHMMQIDCSTAGQSAELPRSYRQKVTGQHQGKPALSITGNETLLIYYPIKSTGFSLLQHVAINWNQLSSWSCVSSRSLFCLAASHVRSGFRYDQDRICFWPSQNPSSILQRVPSTFTSLCMVVPFGNHVVKYYVLSLLTKFRRISRSRVRGFGLEQSNSSAFRSAIGRYVQS